MDRGVKWRRDGFLANDKYEIIVLQKKRPRFAKRTRTPPLPRQDGDGGKCSVRRCAQAQRTDLAARRRIELHRPDFSGSDSIGRCQEKRRMTVSRQANGWRG